MVQTETMDAAGEARARRRIVVAGTIGTAMEWYEFFLYGLIAPFVFSKLFFPAFDPRVGTIAVFATFAVGFLARPIGGLVFGHFGDLIGRRSVLLYTLVLMGLATFAIGLMPGYSEIGIWAPIGLIVLRFLQGFAVGGEATAAGLMAVEAAPEDRRGLFGAFIQASGSIGVIAASLSAMLITMLPEADMLAWGWRIPFYLSGVMMVIGLYIRYQIEESPAFVKAVAQAPREERKSIPIIEAICSHPKSIAIVCFCSAAETAFYYLTGIFALSYVTGHLGLKASVVTVSMLLASVVQLLATIHFGSISDRIGRRKMMLTGLVLSIVTFAVYFPVLNIGSPWAIAIMMIIAVGLVHPLMFGPEASFFAEQFPTHVRFSAVSAGKQIGAVLGGGVAPMIASYLMLSVGTAGVFTYFFVIAIIGIVATRYSVETTKVNIMR